MAALKKELLLAARSLARNRTLTLIIVATLALGIGANSAIFSVVNAALLEPLPFTEPDRLVRVWPGGALPRQGLAWLVADNPVYADVAGYGYVQGLTLTGEQEPLRLDAVKVSANFFDTLGARTSVGRLLRSGDEAPEAPPVVIIAHGLWHNRFGGEVGVVGRSITLEGRSYTVVGVAPRGFRFPERTVQLWMPTRLDESDPRLAWGGQASMQVVARLKDSSTLEQARQQLASFLPRVRDGYPWPMSESYGSNATVRELRADLLGDLGKRLAILLGAVGLVLLIACVNVANLLLARARSRHKEIALRTALGARRWQVVRQLLLESALLGLAGGLAGLALAYLGLGLLRPFLPADLPRIDDIGIDGRVLTFTLLLSLFTSMLFGLLPALRASKPDLQSALKEGARSGGGRLDQRRLSAALVSVEVALSVAVAAGAALLLQTYWNLSRNQLGFDPRNAYVAKAAPSTSRFPDAASQRQFYRELLDRLDATGAAQTASVANLVPFCGSVFGSAFLIEGRPEPQGADWPFAQAHVVASSEHLRSLGLPVLRGRSFEAADRADAPGVVLVNQALADRYWAGEDPVGRRVGLPGRNITWMTIVGVVGDARYDTSTQAPPTLYQPLEQGNTGPMWLVARSDLRLDAFAARLREAVAGLDRDTSISQLQSLERAVSDSLAKPRFTAALLVVFAGLALLLGVVGVYGVTENAVRQRSREMAIRMTLGAEPRAVLWSVLRQVVILVLVGVGFGVLVALLAGGILSGLLYGVSSSDAATLASVALTLAAVAVAAGLGPARRATRIAAAEVLRAE